jgi:tRNA modification GTPase
MNIQDTIAAPATPHGRSAVAVIRVSGDECRNIISKIFKPDFKPSPDDSPRRETVGRIIDPHTGEILDRSMLVFFAAPASYTGEDMIEISTHGNPVITADIMTLLNSIGVRIAEPGEFTYRAFLNGKMDLTQAEAVGALAEASGSAETRSALAQMEGSIGSKLREWKDTMLDLSSRLEADIEFSGESGERYIEQATLIERAEALKADAGRMLDGYRLGGAVKKGAEVVIAGRANTGKSTLFNSFVKSSRSIVTDIPGTTRDVISESVEIEGFPVRLHDTAGLEEHEGPLEREGVNRAYKRIMEADVVILLLDGSAALTDADRNALDKTAGMKRIVAVNKTDIGLKMVIEQLPDDVSRETLCISALTGEGLETLKKTVLTRLGWGDATGSTPILQSERQKDLLLRFDSALEGLITELKADFREEIASIHIRSALKPLEEVLGVSAADDIYNRIFSSFCIGK